MRKVYGESYGNWRVFFKSRNKGAELASWYQKNLGLNLENWGGAILRWPDDKAEDGGMERSGQRHQMVQPERVFLYDQLPG